MKKIFGFLLLALFSITIFACNPKEDKKKEEKKSIDVESVEFNMDKSELTPGEHTLKAKALPDNANQGMEFQLVDNVRGVSIKGDKLTIGLSVEDETKISIRAKSTYNVGKSVVKEFSIKNDSLKVIYISTEEELRAIGKDDESLKKYYKLKNNIVLTKDWVPIGEGADEDKGSFGKNFEGIFDGAGFEISGINYNDITKKDTGFFAQTSSTAIIRNVKLSGEFNTYGWTGGIVGLNHGLVSNVIANIKITVENEVAGAVVARNFTSGRVEFAYATAEIKSKKLPSTAAKSVGLIGAINGPIVDVYGDYELMKTKIYESWSASANDDRLVSTSQMMDATLWKNFDENIWFVANGTYPLLRHEGFVEPDLTSVKTIKFTNTQKEFDALVNNEFEIKVEVINGEAGDVLEYELLGTSIAGITIDQNGKLMLDKTLLSGEYEIEVLVSITGTSFNAKKKFLVVHFAHLGEMIIEISTEDQLFSYLSGNKRLNHLDKDRVYVLKNNINLTKPWVPVGSMLVEGNGEDIPFDGIFDGKGYTISGIEMNLGYNFGFFTLIGENGKIQNTHFKGVVKGASWFGGIAATNRGKIENVIVELDITGNANIGAVTTDNEGVLENVIILGKMSGTIGIVGRSVGQMTRVYVDKETTEIKYISANLKTEDSENKHLFTKGDLKNNTTLYDDFSLAIWHIEEGYYPELKYDGFIPKARKVEITNTDTTISANSHEKYQINAHVVHAKDGDKLFYSLDPLVAGVTIGQYSGELKFDKSLLAPTATFKVIAKIYGDVAIFAEKEFTVTYDSLAQEIEITNNNYFNLNDSLEAQVATNIKNSNGSEVLEYFIVDNTYGVEISNTGLISVDVTKTTSYFKIKVKVQIQGTNIEKEHEFDTYYIYEITENGGYLTTLLGSKDEVVLSRHYVLKNNIENVTWSSIGQAYDENADKLPNIPFSGTFDGKGYAITGISATIGWNQAMFNLIGETGVVKNIKFKGTVTGPSWFAGLVYHNYGKIERVILDLEITGNNSFGVIALRNYESGVIKEVVVLGSVTKTGDNVGLIGALVDGNSIVQLVFANQDTLGLTRYIGGVDDAGTFYKTDAQMKTAATYTGSMADPMTWIITDGNYPELRQY